MGANKCNRFRILTTYDMTDQMANKREEKMEENFTERILLMPLKLLRHACMLQSYYPFV